jgi:hypothetical protein
MRETIGERSNSARAKKILARQPKGWRVGVAEGVGASLTDFYCFVKVNGQTGGKDVGWLEKVRWEKAIAPRGRKPTTSAKGNAADRQIEQLGDRHSVKIIRGKLQEPILGM